MRVPCVGTVAASVILAFGAVFCGSSSASISTPTCLSFSDAALWLPPLAPSGTNANDVIRYYERSTAKFPSNDAFHVALGVAHGIKAISLREVEAFGKPDIEGMIDRHLNLAARELRLVLDINPSNVDAIAYQGLVLSERGQFSDAMECVVRATAIGSTNSTAWYCRGVVQERNRQSQDALDAYATAIRLNPDSLPAYLRLASLYTHIKRYDEALSVSSNALSRFPASSEAVGAMARSLVRVGRAEEAARLCWKWLEEEPGDDRVRYRLGQALAGCGEYDAAIREQTRVLSSAPRLCDAYNEIGVCLDAKGDRDAAIREFRAGLLVHTNCSVLLMNLGNCLAKSGASEEAITILEKSWALNPCSFEVCVPLADAYWQTGQREKARQTCHRLIELMPWVADSYFLLSQFCLDAGEYDLAVQYGREGLQREPTAPWGWQNIGVALQRQHKWLESVAPLARAVELRPSDIDLRMAHVDSLRLAGQFEDAMTTCRLAASAFPTNPLPVVMMGVVWETQDLFTNAVASFRQAVALDTNRAETFFRLAQASNAAGLLADALDAYGQAIARAPTNTIYRAGLVSTLYQHGDRDEARRALDESLALAPNDPVLRMVQAQFLAGEGNVAEAVAVLEGAVAVCPHDSSCRFSLGHFQETLGQKEAAVSNWLIVARNDPLFPAVHQRLALTYARAGQLQDALREFRQYAALAPADGNAHNDLGYTYYQLGMLDEAIRTYQTAIACNPRIGIIYYNLAMAYHAKGQLQEAAECYDKAAAAGYPGNPAFARLLRSYRKEKKPEPTTPPTVR